MRSLFIRILFWFLLATTATSTVVIVTSTWLAQPNLLNYFVGGLLGASLEQAREAYERDGAEGLRRFTAAFDRGFVPGVRVTDASGRDLLTGEDFASNFIVTTHLSRAVVNRSVMVFINKRLMLTKSSADGRYRIFLPVTWTGEGRGLWRPPLILGFLAVVVLCWALARHLSRPVVELQHAAERFGAGDTSVRSGSGATRSDEIGRLARAFDGMADRIDELVQGQRRLLLDISHELRSPLARLTIATDLLRSDPHDEASLQQIEIEADRLNQLIGEILQAARPDSAETKRRFEDVRLDQLLREVVDACRIEATEGRRIELTIEGVREAGTQEERTQEFVVRGNREWLRRAIENVLRNAVRHAPAGTSVDVALAGESIRVRDRGPGVPDAALPHLFTPFYRVDADRERATGGVGLGLAIARRGAELHGGVISARNAQPGLEVEICLPASAVTRTAAPA
jgi:signal transduction histidine kinase